MIYLIYVLAVGFVVLRFAGEKGEFYQALAHFFVAYLFTASYYEIKTLLDVRTGKRKLYVALILTFLVEVPAALWFTFHK